jgi:hypothetical protein
MYPQIKHWKKIVQRRPTTLNIHQPAGKASGFANDGGFLTEESSGSGGQDAIQRVRNKFMDPYCNNRPIPCPSTEALGTGRGGETVSGRSPGAPKKERYQSAQVTHQPTATYRVLESVTKRLGYQPIPVSRSLEV